MDFHRFPLLSNKNHLIATDLYRLTTPGYPVQCNYTVHSLRISAAASFIFIHLTKGSQCQKGYPFEGAEHLESHVLSHGTNL